MNTWPPDVTKPPPLLHVPWPPILSQPPPSIDEQFYSPTSPLRSPTALLPPDELELRTNDEIMEIIDQIIADVNQPESQPSSSTHEKQKIRKSRKDRKVKKLQSEISDLIKF